SGRAKTEQTKDAGRPRNRSGTWPTEDAGMRGFAAGQALNGTCGRGHSVHQPRRLLDEGDQRVEKTRSDRAVDRAMVEREREDERGADRWLAADRDDPVRDPADGEDRRLWCVDDRAERVDAEHAEVRDRERAALDVVQAELPGAGARDEVGAAL